MSCQHVLVVLIVWWEASSLTAATFRVLRPGFVQNSTQQPSGVPISMRFVKVQEVQPYNSTNMVKEFELNGKRS